MPRRGILRDELLVEGPIEDPPEEREGAVRVDGRDRGVSLEPAADLAAGKLAGGIVGEFGKRPADEFFFAKSSVRLEVFMFDLLSRSLHSKLDPCQEGRAVAWTRSADRRPGRDCTGVAADRRRAPKPDFSTG